jgi:hypothetical protein
VPGRGRAVLAVKRLAARRRCRRRPYARPQSADGTRETITYRYNAEGQRVYVKREGGSARHLIRDGGARLGVIEDGSVQHWTLTRPSGTAVGRYRTSPGDWRYYVTGRLGSVRAVITRAEEVKERRAYYPQGLRLPEHGKQAKADSTRQDFTGHACAERDSAY